MAETLPPQGSVGADMGQTSPKQSEGSETGPQAPKQILSPALMQTSQVNADIYTVCRNFSHGGSRVQMVFRIFRILLSSQSVGVHSIFGTPVIDMCRRAPYVVHMLSELLSQSVGVHSTFGIPLVNMYQCGQYFVHMLPWLWGYVCVGGRQPPPGEFLIQFWTRAWPQGVPEASFHPSCRGFPIYIYIRHIPWRIPGHMCV